MSDLIISQMPKHKAYLEPFMGSLAVFLNKDKAVLETINDKDSRLVNLFTVMRDEPEKLQYKIFHTLYSEELLESLIHFKGPAIVSGYESDLYNDA